MTDATINMAVRVRRYHAFNIIASMIVAVTVHFGVAQTAAQAQTSTVAPKNPQIIVFAGRIAGDGNSTRVFFDFDQKAEFRSFYMSEPDRIVIDAGSLLFRFADLSALEPRGLVSFLRYGAIAKERSRIVLSLAGPAIITGFAVEEIEKDKKYRLVVDLSKTTDVAFKQAAARQRQLVGTSGEVASKGDRVRVEEKRQGRFTVVIDPGHGGIDGGATGKAGTREKDMTLAMARRIANDIAAAGPFDVKLTRDDDFFLSLRERVNFTRRQKADLVISIHADTLRQNEVRGASIYTLSKKASDELARELAESENLADIVAGLEASADEVGVTDILADLTARETSVFSRSFSATLAATLGGGIQMIKNPQRSAAFVVLKAPEVPGVLFELGYLSNTEDETQMNDPKWQESVAQLVAKSVVAFFASR